MKNRIITLIITLSIFSLNYSFAQNNIETRGSTCSSTLDIDHDCGSVTISLPTGEDFLINEDDADPALFVDGNTGRVGIGTTTPEVNLNVIAPTANIATFEVSNESTTAAIRIRGKRRSGANDDIATVVFRNYDDDDASEFALAKISAARVTGTAQEGYLRFYTRTNATTFNEKMRITKDGEVGINTTSPSAKLDVVGTFQYDHTSATANYVLVSTNADGDAVWMNLCTLLDSLNCDTNIFNKTAPSAEISALLEQKDKEINDLKTELDVVNDRLAKIEEMLTQNSSINFTSFDVLSSIEQSFPNPFANSTTIKYTLSKDAERASVRIMDASGKLVTEQQVEAIRSGQVTFNLSDYSSGIYFYSLIVNGDIVATKPMTKM